MTPLSGESKLVYKKSPAVTFPHNTERVFADYRHKLLVPSADSYFKHDHKRREAGREYGLAFHAQQESNFVKQPAKTIAAKPARFDPYIDLKHSQ